MLEPFGIDVLGAVAGARPRRALSPVALRHRERALDLARSERLGRGLIIGRIVPLDGVDDGTLLVDGERLPAPRLIPESGHLTAVACCVCTLGASLGERVSALFAEGRRSLALTLDGLGNEFLFELSRRMEDRLLASCRRSSLSMAGELRAGDPGLALNNQAAIVRLAGGDRVGVSVTGTAMLSPARSLSALFGVGIDLPKVHWSRCDDCPSQSNCGHRRQLEESGESRARPFPVPQTARL